MTENTIDDPRLRFYLERRKQIEEWAKLRTLESDAANSFLRGLSVDLEAAAVELGGDVVVSGFDVDGEEILGLCRRTWQIESGDRPLAIAGVAWYPKKVGFEGSSFDTPWVGFRVRRSEAFTIIRTEIGERIRTESIGKSLFPAGNPTGTTGWVRYRLVPCKHPSYWDDLAPYRSEIIAAVRQSFDVFSSVVDDLLGDVAR